MSQEQLYELQDAEYRGNEFSPVEQIRTSKRRRPVYARRRGKEPQSFNGIHKRRKRKTNW